jgi:hypothetical protein
MSIDTLFHTAGKASPTLKKLFQALGVSIQTLEEAHQFAQQELLRVGESWDPQPPKALHDIIRRQQPFILHQLHALGMVQAHMPTQKEHTYALLLGSLYEDVVERFSYLSHLYDADFQFKYLVLVGSERSLLDHEKAQLPEGLTTEAQMLFYLCRQYPHLKNKYLMLINAPRILQADGSFARATTESTLKHFMQRAQEPGSCLIISNNPYIWRQTKVAQRTLDQTQFPTQGAGAAYKESLIDSILLMDEFARTLYEVHHSFVKNTQ